MGLTQTKLHELILLEKWSDVVIRVETRERGLIEARTANPLGDLPLHYLCYSGKAPPRVVRCLLEGYPDGASHRNKKGFTPRALAEVNYRSHSAKREVLAMLTLAENPSRDRLRRHYHRGSRSEGSSVFVSAETNTPTAELSTMYVVSETCVVCLDRPADHVVIPCGHLCACQECALKMRRDGDCPVCRSSVSKIVPTNKATLEGCDETA